MGSVAGRPGGECREAGQFVPAGLFRPQRFGQERHQAGALQAARPIGRRSRKRGGRDGPRMLCTQPGPPKMIDSGRGRW